MQDTTLNIPELVKAVRNKLNLKQHELANLLNGVSMYTVVSKWERSEREPSHLTVVVLQYILECNDIDDNDFINFLKGRCNN